MTKAVCSAWIATFLCLALHGQAQSQQQQPSIGDRVRLQLSDGSRVTGRLIAIDRSRLLVRRSRADTIRITSETVGTYSIATGVDRRRGVRRGALWGGLAGATLVAAAVHSDVTSKDLVIPVTILAVPAGLAMTGIGAVVGAFWAPIRWTPPRAMRR